MTGRRYRNPYRASSLMLLLASSLLPERPPPRIPGKRLQKTKVPCCDTHKDIELKPLKDTGKLYCPKCPGRVFEPPKTGT